MDRNQAIKELTGAGGEFELYTRELYGRSCRCFVDLPETLKDLFCEARSSETFIVYEDERLSFEEAWVEASKLGDVFVNKYGLVSAPVINKENNIIGSIKFLRICLN